MYCGKEIFIPHYSNFPKIRFPLNISSLSPSSGTEAEDGEMHVTKKMWNKKLTTFLPFENLSTVSMHSGLLFQATHFTRQELSCRSVCGCLRLSVTWWVSPILRINIKYFIIATSCNVSLI